MEKLEWVKADAATIKAFEASQKTEVETAREAAEAEANYRMNLECAEIALRDFKRLTAGDREDIEIAVMHLKKGWALHEQSSGPIQLRRAANYLMFAAHVIGSRCTICDSEKIYRDIEAHGEQGRNTGTLAREKAEEWKGPARQYIAKKIDENGGVPPKRVAARLARSLKGRGGGKPGVNYPEIETLTRFIRGELKKLKSGARNKGKNLRLVRG
jgi:hypothetical protein